MTPGRIVAAIAGVLLAPAAIGLLIGGLAVVVAMSVSRDDGLFLTSTDYTLQSDGYALFSDEIAIAPHPGDWWPSDAASVRITVEPEGDQSIFVGIGPSADVEAYLAGVAASAVDRLGRDGDDVRYRDVSGEAPSAAPESLGFWAASSTASGRQNIDWEVERGAWSVVIMNADASRRVAVSAEFGVDIPALQWIGIAMIVGGLVVGAISAALLVLAFGVGRNGAAAGSPAAAAMGSRTASETPYPVLFEARIDEPLSRWMWLVKWFLAIPHVIILALLWGLFFFISIVAFFAILFTGRYPRGLFDFNVGVMRWSWRVMFYAFSVVATDRYPPFSLADDPDYPARFDVAYPERLSRGLVLVKWWLLAIPHYIIVGFLTSGIVWWTTDVGGGGDGILEIGGGLLGILSLIALIILLFTGRYPRSLFELLVGLNRWVFRVAAYAALMRDEYPPFRLDLGGTEPQGPVPNAGIYDPNRPPPTTE